MKNQIDTHSSKITTLTITEKSMASVLGGIASKIFTLALEVLVAKRHDMKKAGLKVFAVQLFIR